MNCDWNVFVSIKNYIKPKPKRLQTLSHCVPSNVIILTKYNLNKQRQFQTDDRQWHDQQQGGIQKLLCQNGDDKWLPLCHISFCSRFVPDRVINRWIAALKSNGRHAGLQLRTNVGLVIFGHCVQGTIYDYCCLHIYKNAITDDCYMCVVW